MPAVEFIDSVWLTAIVHSAATSNVGQMLNRVCLEHNIGLVNIVRDSRGAELLRAAGAKYVLDSTKQDLRNQLVAARDGEKGSNLAKFP
jgi:NADPH2:quinone reductase